MTKTIVPVNPVSEFTVGDEEIEQMVDELKKEGCWEDNDIDHLSRSWIRALMSQPYKKNKLKRRPFDYSKKKIMSYLDWRKKSGISSKIKNHFESDGAKFAKLTTSQGSLYWYGVDSEGSPNLWFHSSLINFDKAVVKDEMECTALIIQAAIDSMPDKIHNFNFILCFDKFDLVKAIKKPYLAPAFIKTFMVICPDRLKKAYFVTGAIGHIFYKVAKNVAPASIMDKVTETRSREETAKLLVDECILDVTQLPCFLGGAHDHQETITSHYPNMIQEIRKAMTVGITRI